MPNIELYHTGTGDDQKEMFKERKWRRKLAILCVGLKTAAKMTEAILGDVPAGTHLELHVKNTEKGPKKGRSEVAWSKEGRASNVPAEAVLEASQPPPAKVAKKAKPPKKSKKVSKNELPRPRLQSLLGGKADSARSASGQN